MRQRRDHLDTLAVTVLLLCCTFWGLQQILIKAVVGEVPALWQASLRTLGATVLLYLWCRLRGIALFDRDGSLGAGLLAGTLFAAEFVFIYLGLRETSASRLTVFLYTSPFWVALLLPRFVPSERLRGWQWAGLVLAFAAVAVAFAEAFLGSAGLADHWRGDVFGLAAGAMWGLTTLVIRSTRLSTVSAEKSLFYQLGVTALLAPLVSLALGETWSLHFSARAWTSLGLQTVVGAFASYLAWMWLLRHYPATKVTSFTFLTPMWALVFGVLLLSEPLTPQLLVALAGVAVGLVLVNRRPAAPSKPGR